MSFFVVAFFSLGLLDSIIHSLLDLKLVRFVVELTSAEQNLIDVFWPKEVGDSDDVTMYTVFGLSDEEYRQLDNLLPTSAVSRVLLGHIVEGKIFSYTLKQGDIITPLDGNFSLHVATVGNSLSKVST